MSDQGVPDVHDLRAASAHLRGVAAVLERMIANGAVGRPAQPWELRSARAGLWAALNLLDPEP